MNVYIDGKSSHKVSQFVFNDGSVQIELEKNIPEQANHIYVDARVQTPTDQMALVLLKSALDSLYPVAQMHLAMPFCPYGRQDAAFVHGQANGMKAWAGVVNSLKFDTVTVLDAHSLAVQFIDNVREIGIVDILRSSKDFVDYLQSYESVTLISPDAGANKKAHKICQYFGIPKLVRADKARDLATGNIIETELFGEVKDEVCVIVDDICDGGMTFIKLAEKLKERGAHKVILFVTHGMFTKGLGVFEGLIDEIYTTQSWDRKPMSSDSEYTGGYTVCIPKSKAEAEAEAEVGAKVGAKAEAEAEA